MILDFRSNWPELKNIATFKYNCDKKIYSAYWPNQIFTDQGNMTSANVADW